MTEYLEEEKEKLIARLTAAETPDKAEKILGDVCDRILVKSSESMNSERMRACASQMLSAVKMALPLTDTVGDVKLWSRADAARSDRKAVTGHILAGVGAALVVAAAFVMMGPTGILKVLGTIVPLVMLLAGMVLLFIGGRKSAVPKTGGRDEVKTECVVDAAKIYRILHGVCLVMDQNLKTIADEEAWKETHEKAPAAEGMSAQELTLYADLLEAVYSGDAAYAFDKMNAVRFYLHTKKIDVVDYSAEHAGWFDCMPSVKQGTLRPALVSGGKLLKKGLAAA